MMGTRPPEKPKDADVEGAEVTSADLEQAVLAQIHDINFDEYLDHLFVDKTQRDVDRALRNLAASARREYIDKGLRTLYLAIGELRWIEDSGDIRRSPLILIPVELITPGPRERMYVEFSDDDIAVNPALSLRLSEDYGLNFPTTEEVLRALESGGVDSALSLFRHMKFPDKWEVMDFACLGAFMFAKEAMYRDLLDNEEKVAESAIIQTLSGAVGAEASDFIFDPYGDDQIDDVAPPESTPLVLDADASQRAAIQAAIEGRSFTLDGPPGTGKSQTIANIIGGLIEAGKSVLFVSEKAVALDVVRDRLSARGLDPFLFALHSSKASRKEVAARLGSALTSRPTVPARMSPVRISQLREARIFLTDYVMAANERREPLGASFHQVLGWLEKVRSDFVGPPFAEDVRQLSATDLAVFEGTIARLESLWSLHLMGGQATWFGLTQEDDLRYLLDRLDTCLVELGPLLLETRGVRAAFDLESIEDYEVIASLLERWHAEPVHHADSWLDSASFAALIDAVGDYERTSVQLVQAEATALAVIGPSWHDLPVPAEARSPELDRDLLHLPGVSAESTQEMILLAQSAVGGALSGLQNLQVLADALAVQVGATRVTCPSEARQLLDAVRALLSSDPPHLDWVYDQLLREKAIQQYELNRAAKEALDAAELKAKGAFTAQVLSCDLDEIEALASSTRGFFRRFGSDHRTMRVALAGISQLGWKNGRGSLPKARVWVEANTEFLRQVRSAGSSLGPLFESPGSTDWDRLSRSLGSAVIAGAARFSARNATDRMLSDETRRTEALDLLVLLEQSVSDWEAEHDLWAAPSEGYSGAALEKRLVDRAMKLQPLVDTVAGQVEQLGQRTTLGVHLESAAARADSFKAEQAAVEAQARLAQLARSEPSAFGTDGVAAPDARRKVEWARTVLSSVGGEVLTSFTPEQIEALQISKPKPGSADVVGEYQKLMGELIQSFGEHRRAELHEDLRDYATAQEIVALFRDEVEQTDDWFLLQRTLEKGAKIGLAPAIAHAQSEHVANVGISDFLRSTVYQAWLNAQLSDDNRLGGSYGTSCDDMVERFRALDSELADAAVSSVIEAGLARRPKSTAGQSAIIIRESEKKRRHIPVRDLINQARDVILANHPCFMMSPLAVSQYLPAEQIFDVVIFDEASQVLPADAINCIYRASSVITAGDQKQLPPTSFFEAAVDEADEDDEEDLANDFESILDLMKGSGSFTTQTLRWHYRSRHEHLIAYSNASFYGSKLITFPGAISDSSDAGVNFIKVPGIYRRSAGQDNPIEAKRIAERVIHHFSTRPGKSLGVVAFSTAQRDAIETAVELARAERPDLDGYFGDDRSQGFFVKSLESVQGDERDVVIFSIGYGPDENGKLYKNFGPVSRKGGERRLNVAITRAKELVEVVTSMSASEIGDVNSEGARHLRRYLDFAERGPAALAIELGAAGLDTESPFEDAVVGFVRSLGFDVQPQVGVAGYRIDLGVKHPNQPGAFMLGIECDGAMYHSSRAARDRDRIRHQILEGLGWNLHHIWGTAWYRHPQREKERLRMLLEDLSNRPVTGRLVSPAPALGAQVAYEVQEHVYEENPGWVEDYVVSKPERIPSRIDLSDSGNANRLVALVEEVVRVEAPVHLEVLTQRLRAASSYGRVGARIRVTLNRAIKKANVLFDGEFLRASNKSDVRVRRPANGFTRPVAQISDDEFRLAITNLVTDAVGISQDDVVARVSAIFGWQRAGADIRARAQRAIAQLIKDGAISDRGAGLRMNGV
jgi:very-short-patch-repair endonuclease